MTNSANSFYGATDTFGRDYVEPYDNDNEVSWYEPYGDEESWRLSPCGEFLYRLRPDGPWTLIAIDPDNGRLEVRTLASITEINAFVAKWNGERNLYYAVNPTRQLWMHKKAEKEDIDEIRYLLSDLDPVGEESPERAKQRYLEELETFTPRPTMLMDSGNGLQALWQLKPPIPLAEPSQLDKPIKVKGKLITRQFSPADQAKVADVEARSAALMRRLGAPAGTQNIDRILRLPGTVNLPNKVKRAKGRVPCETQLLWFEWTKYSLQDFELSPQAEKPAAAQAAPEGTMWRNRDHDIPVDVVNEPAMRGSDGRMYQKVQFEGKETYVPADELVMTPQAHATIRKRNGAAGAHHMKVPAGLADVYELDDTDSGFGFRFHARPAP
jgi:hypothetical protein